MSLIRPVTFEEFLHPISDHIVPIFAFSGRQSFVGGTAVILAPGLAVTAKHVLEEIQNQFNVDKHAKSVELDMHVIQFRTNALWHVSHVSSWVGSDLAVLSLRPRNDIAIDTNVNRLVMTVDPPIVGSTVTALGYPKTALTVAHNDSEMLRMEFSVSPTVSVGRVLDVHASLRDTANVRFPSFSVAAEYASGMSGGAVFNEHRHLCGLVCSGGEGELKGHSVATSIWPMAIIPARIPPDAPSYEGIVAGRDYKVLDLARLGYLVLVGHERIEFFTDTNGSDGVRRHHSS